MLLNKKIGHRIRSIRQSNELKQGELAKILEIQPSLLSMYELGHREPPVKFLDEFCNYFEISLAQFFRFDDLNIDTKEKSQLDDVLLQLQNLTGELENRFFKKLAGEHIAKSISD